MMRIFALACAEFAIAAEKAAGETPLLSPPLVRDDLQGRISNYDLYYFHLHGTYNGRAWFNTRGDAVLTASDIEAADLGGALVFAANCHAGDPASPMREALLRAGARAVIAGDGENYSATNALTGAARLGAEFLRQARRGRKPKHALALAKVNLLLSKPTRAWWDALQFRIWEA